MQMKTVGKPSPPHLPEGRGFTPSHCGNFLMDLYTIFFLKNNLF